MGQKKDDADDAYLNHAKAFMVNCRRQGAWRGDFCMITPAQTADDFQQRGIEVFRVAQGQWDFMVKFWTFTPYFNRWQEALCIDLDVLVQADLNAMFDRLAARLPAILCDREDGDILGGLRHWDQQRDSHQDSYARLQARFPHVTSRMFNAGFIFYAPGSMPQDTREQLIALDKEFREINPTKADQMLLNLLFYDRMEVAGKDAICFFGNDHPGSRVASEGRGWTGNEVPTVLHYTRWHAPWIVKQAWQPEWGLTPGQQADLTQRGIKPEMGGYSNQRLGRICHELYAENLAAFEEVFPHG